MIENIFQGEILSVSLPLRHKKIQKKPLGNCAQKLASQIQDNIDCLEKVWNAKMLHWADIFAVQHDKGACFFRVKSQVGFIKSHQKILEHTKSRLFF